MPDYKLLLLLQLKILCFPQEEVILCAQKVNAMISVKLRECLSMNIGAVLII